MAILQRGNNLRQKQEQQCAKWSSEKETKEAQNKHEKRRSHGEPILSAMDGLSIQDLNVERKTKQDSDQKHQA
jgi:hypothetical protein